MSLPLQNAHLPDESNEPHALDLLWRTIDERRNADPATSYTASLLARAPTKPAQKLAEEAAECAIEAVRGDAAALVRESADLLFHLLVVMAGSGGHAGGGLCGARGARAGGDAGGAEEQAGAVQAGQAGAAGAGAGAGNDQDPLSGSASPRRAPRLSRSAPGPVRSAPGCVRRTPRA